MNTKYQILNTFQASISYLVSRIWYAILIGKDPKSSQSDNTKYKILNTKYKRGRKLILTLGMILLLGFIALRFVKGTRAVSWWTGGGGSWQARKQLTVTNNI